MKSGAEYILGSWLWQILGAIRAVARTGEPGEIDFPSAKFHEI